MFFGIMEKNEIILISRRDTSHQTLTSVQQMATNEYITNSFV